MTNAFPFMAIICQGGKNSNKPKTIALEMRGRLFFTQETGVLDLEAKSLLVWIMSNNLIFSCKPQRQESTLSSWASIIVSSLLARGSGLPASKTNIPRSTEIYCQAKSTYFFSIMSDFNSAFERTPLIFGMGQEKLLFCLD